MARDLAGNLGARTAPTRVVLRYIALGRKRIVVASGRRFALRVSADAMRVEWHLGARSGSVAPGTIHIRAPVQPGRYTLTVREHGHAVRAAVIVRAAPVNELARVAGPLAAFGLAVLSSLRGVPSGSADSSVGRGDAGSRRLSSLRHEHGELAAAGVGGLVVAAVGAWLLVRYPWLLAFATLACVPVRIPVTLGSEDANLLVPLYAVVGSWRWRSRGSSYAVTSASASWARSRGRSPCSCSGQV